MGKEIPNQLNRLNDRFSRWQEMQISLMTFGINLLFTLSIATVGFILNNFDSTVFKDKLVCGYSLPHTAAFVVVLSSLLGIMALFCRLFDFRFTKDTIRARRFLFKVKNKILCEYSKELTETDLKKKIANLKSCTKKLGCATWWLFSLQTVIYFVGVIIILLNI